MKKRSLASALPLALIGAVAASGLLLLACETEVPTPARDADEIAAEAEAETETAAQIEVGDPAADTPQFTPFTVRPEVQNRPEVQRALEREYPAGLREAGIGGTVRLHFFIDEEGRV